MKILCRSLILLFFGFFTAVTLGELSVFAAPMQLFTDPFHNKVFRWDGTTMTNATLSVAPATPPSPQSGDLIVVSDTVLDTSAPPLVWAEDEILFATQGGEIYTFDTLQRKLNLIYRSADRCQGSLGYSGCIFTMIVRDTRKAYFLEHTRDDTDTLMELTPHGVRPLISGIPGPSGPIWMRPNGNLGALPYGHGVFDIPIPNKLKKLSELGSTQTPWDTMASVAIEGRTSAQEDRLAIFDYSAILMKTPTETRKLADAKAVAFDPCSGMIWYLDAQQALQSYFSGKNIYTNDLPVNPYQCPVVTYWKVIERMGSKMNEDRLDVIQGFPSGKPRVPSTTVVSLGKGGSITIESSRTIVPQGRRPDFRIFENVFQHSAGLYIEPARVEIWDGGKWISTGCDCAQPNPAVCAGMQVTNSYPGNGIEPWGDHAGGFPVSLVEYGITSTRKIRITDCANGSPGSSEGAFAGFDLDAVSVSPASLAP
jgi:hypothetical protein